MQSPKGNPSEIRANFGRPLDRLQNDLLSSENTLLYANVGKTFHEGSELLHMITTIFLVLIGLKINVQKTDCTTGPDCTSGSATVKETESSRRQLSLLFWLPDATHDLLHLDSCSLGAGLSRTIRVYNLVSFMVHINSLKGLDAV